MSFRMVLPAVVILVASTVYASTKEDDTAGQWEQVGKSGGWSQTLSRRMKPYQGYLYTVERNGGLYKTDRNGRKERIGKNDFSDVVHMVFIYEALYTHTKDGNLNKVDISTGDTEQIGKSGGWMETRKMVAFAGRIFTLESNGSLYRTDKNGKKERVGNSGEFADTVGDPTAMDSYLWTVEKSGRLFKTDKDGSWEQVGKREDWGNTLHMTALNGYLWTIDKDGTLYKTDREGRRERVSHHGEFDDTIAFTAMEGYLWTIEKSGSLFKTKTQ